VARTFPLDAGRSDHLNSPPSAHSGTMIGLWGNELLPLQTILGNLLRRFEFISIRLSEGWGRIESYQLTGERYHFSTTDIFGAATQLGISRIINKESQLRLNNG